jgi:phosphoribosylformylglycinamidine cyclo-ligase
VKPVLNLMKKIKIKGMAHITGGGFIENAPRMFATEGLQIVINKNSYPLPKIFKLINERGVDLKHMYNTFNMGIGFIICIDKKDINKALSILKSNGERAYEIGYIAKGKEQVKLV